jgi:hypothetical protein
MLEPQRQLQPAASMEAMWQQQQQLEREQTHRYKVAVWTSAKSPVQGEGFWGA